jgi:hypothetical protein
MTRRALSDFLVGLGSLGALEFFMLVVAARWARLGSAGDGTSSGWLSSISGRGRRRRLAFWLRATPFVLAACLVLVAAGVFLR